MYRCKDTGENVASPPLKPVLRHLLFFCRHFGGNFASNGRTIAKIQATILFLRLKIRFCDIRCSFLSILMFILLTITYICQDIGENIALPALKPVLRHSPFFFEHFGGFFCVK